MQAHREIRRRAPSRGVALFTWFVCLFAAPAAQAANLAPTISGTPATRAVIGQSYWFQPKASDPEGATLKFSIARKPAWAKFSAASGALYGTPTAASVSSNIVISVSDGLQSRSLPAFTLTAAANRPPVISGTPPASVKVGTAYYFRPTASDPDGQKLTYSVQNKPAWLAFSTATGTLKNTPTAANVGTYSNIVIRVSDGLTSVALPAFTLTVGGTAPVNRAPTLTGTPGTVAGVGQAYTFAPVGADADGDALTYTISGRPTWASFDTRTGRLTGTPALADVRTWSGIAIAVSDGKVSTALPAFSITVQQASSGSVTLSWTAPTRRTDGSALTTLAGYRVYYGTAQGSYPNRISVANPGLVTYVVDNLPPATYWFVMTAYDSANLESAQSTPVSVTVR